MEEKKCLFPSDSDRTCDERCRYYQTCIRRKDKEKENDMGKNNKLINNLNEIARRNRENMIIEASDRLVPHVYAGIAIALHRECGWGYTRIARVFAESQRLWSELGSETMVDLCEKETGITLKGEENEDISD